MTADERDRLILFLIERHEEVMAEINMLKDTQLKINNQMEKLTKVVFGLTQQVTEITRKFEQEQETIDDFRSLGRLPKPPRKK